MVICERIIFYRRLGMFACNFMINLKYFTHFLDIIQEIQEINQVTRNFCW